MKLPSRDRLLWAAPVVGCAMLLVAAFATVALVPLPTPQNARRTGVEARRTLERSIGKTRAETRAAVAQTRARMWTGGSDAVTSALVATLSREAASRGVKLAAVRSQRTQNFGGTTELPFVVQLVAPYPAVQSLLARLDDPGVRLAVASVQIASSDAASNTVTATVDLSVYVAAQAPLPATRQAGGVH